MAPRRLPNPFEYVGRRCLERRQEPVFNDAKGYGFIALTRGTKDFFVHFSNIAGEGFKSLSEGARVEYEAREGKVRPARPT